MLGQGGFDNGPGLGGNITVQMTVDKCLRPLVGIVASASGFIIFPLRKVLDFDTLTVRRLEAFPNIAKNRQVRLIRLANEAISMPLSARQRRSPSAIALSISPRTTRQREQRSFIIGGVIILSIILVHQLGL